MPILSLASGARPVFPYGTRKNAGGTSPLYTIRSMTPLDAYHCGQIRLLHALQGVPAKPF
ncbi:MAG TPA: hypothetical protein VGA58_11300 [bacterium]